MVGGRGRDGARPSRGGWAVARGCGFWYNIRQKANQMAKKANKMTGGTGGTRVTGASHASLASRARHQAPWRGGLSKGSRLSRSMAATAAP